ncbi:MAG: HD domain-containing protein [Arcobacteraceae bacterium]|nr:HD domain-containing protein [Arcobacteraceae bacterium]MDY0327430.1 HD domain-containing protein [Arcobacteraceae bacterium]
MTKRYLQQTYKFLPIKKDILKYGESYPYSIYRKTDDKIFDLLLTKSTVFNKSLQCFSLDQKQSDIYILDSDKSLYQGYIQKHIKTLLEDRNISLDVKSSLIKEIASETINDLFQSDLTSENLQKVNSILNHSIQLILSDKKAMYSMLKVTSYDYYTYTHCVDVATYAIGFGSFLKLDLEELELLGKAAMLHDIGKKLIPHDIISKDSRLTQQEFEQVKNHSMLGAKLLQECGENQRLINLVMQHHEKCDGSGYPLNLKEKEIDNLAKIISICDVFNALTTRRVYKERMSSFDAFKIMFEDMKNHFSKQYLMKFLTFMGCTKEDFN